MPNYKNGKVYKIVCNTTGKVYIGSTTVLLCKRLACHVNHYKRGVYTTSSKEILEGGNYSIVLIENVECETKEQLLRRERYYMETIECVNKHRPIVSVEEAKEYHKEYRENNKEKVKEYYDVNKEVIKEQMKQYHKENKAKHNERNKEYYKENKDKISQQKKEYRENHKEKIALKDKQRGKERRLKKNNENKKQ